MKADIVEKAKNRTCKPAWSGLKYVPSFGHINSELVYDEQAVRCLNEKHLRESDFEVLPEGYNKVQKKKRKSNK